jgi:hypothetical protein
MSRGTKARLIGALILLVAGFVYVWRANPDPTRVTFFLTAAVCAATVIYALLTLEILIQNQSMAKAAADSAASMERGLRFSYASNLLYRTFSTKDPRLANRQGCTPVKNEDYTSASRGYSPEQTQMEFVFCEVLNVGRGPATNLTITAEYSVHDASNPAKNFSVKRETAIQLLEPNSSAALLICHFTIPTAGDFATLVKASMRASDFYSDALQEPPLTLMLGPEEHHCEPAPDCTVRLA